MTSWRHLIGCLNGLVKREGVQMRDQYFLLLGPNITPLCGKKMIPLHVGKEEFSWPSGDPIGS